MAAKKKTAKKKVESENVKIKRLLKELRSLSLSDLLFVTGESLGGQVETDLNGQILIYTGMEYGKDGEVIEVEEEA